MKHALQTLLHHVAHLEGLHNIKNAVDDLKAAFAKAEDATNRVSAAYDSVKHIIDQNKTELQKDIYSLEVAMTDSVNALQDVEKAVKEL